MSSAVTTCLVVVLSVLMMFLRNNVSWKERIARKLQNSMMKLNRHVPVSLNFQLQPSPYFKRAVGLDELYDSLIQFQEYRVRALGQNGMIFHRTRDLDPHSLHQLRQLNYFEKISDVNQAISKNQDVVEAIIGHTLRQLVQKNDPEGPNVHEVASISKGLGYVINSDNEIQKVPHDVVPGSQSNQGRINEALAHICRDWHSDYEKERKPLTDFINSRLNHLKGNGRTLIVVPGSGAGCIPYEIAKQFPDFEIHSIEFSTLMYLCNEFVLGHDDQITLMPFAQHYSSQERAEFQLRDLSIDLQKFQKPSNLKVHLGDFRGYNPGSEYDQIVVCSAYFIDTAENLFEYFKSIENLRSSAKSLHWINAGPLKYGTRPLVQLTSDELTKLRQLRNWKDLYSDCDAVHLNGYLTDEHSLYQGYYGLVKFHSVYTGN